LPKDQLEGLATGLGDVGAGDPVGRIASTLAIAESRDNGPWTTDRMVPLASMKNWVGSP
jgi:hypothetical protein